MKRKCAIIDFDGTLFDSMFVWDNVGETFLHSLGITPKPSMREDVRALSLYQSACYFQKEYGLTLSVHEIMDAINGIIEHFYTDVIMPKNGAVNFLTELKKAGIARCIATASERQLVEAALARCGMAPYIDAIFTCTETGCGKDEPAIFRAAMEEFGADRSTSVVFEDALHAVRTAKNDGFTVAAIYDPSETHQSELRLLADHYISDFEQADVAALFANKCL